MILHRPHRLPGQIAAMMAGTIVVFALTLGISVVWMSRALDRQARIDSARLVASAVSALESEMLAVNLEFAKWDHLVRALEEPDAATAAGCPSRWRSRNAGRGWTRTGRDGRSEESYTRSIGPQAPMTGTCGKQGGR